MTHLDRLLFPITTLAWLALAAAFPNAVWGDVVTNEAELRTALLNNSVSTITFSGVANNTITLTDNLPLIFHDVAIDGEGVITIDGDKDGAAGGYRVFFAGSGSNITLTDITIENGAARGGAGAGNGGGGLGAGGALFVDFGAEVTLTNVTFTSNVAVGGDGGSGD